MFFIVDVKEQLLNVIVQITSLKIHIDSSETELKYDKYNVNSLIDQNYIYTKRKISVIEI